MTNRFEDLKVWQKAHQYVLDVYSKRKNEADEIGKMINGLIAYLKKSQ